jgi:hypothetical protein
VRKVVRRGYVVQGLHRRRSWIIPIRYAPLRCLLSCEREQRLRKAEPLLARAAKGDASDEGREQSRCLLLSYERSLEVILVAGGSGERSGKGLGMVDHLRTSHNPRVKLNSKRGRCRKAKKAGAVNHFLLIYKVGGILWEHCQYCDKAWRVNPKPGRINYIPPLRKNGVRS